MARSTLSPSDVGAPTTMTSLPPPGRDVRSHERRAMAQARVLGLRGHLIEAITRGRLVGAEAHEHRHDRSVLRPMGRIREERPEWGSDRLVVTGPGGRAVGRRVEPSGAVGAARVERVVPRGQLDQREAAGCGGVGPDDHLAPLGRGLHGEGGIERRATHEQLAVAGADDSRG